MFFWWLLLLLQIHYQSLHIVRCQSWKSLSFSIFPRRIFCTPNPINPPRVFLGRKVLQTKQPAYNVRSIFFFQFTFFGNLLLDIHLMSYTHMSKLLKYPVFFSGILIPSYLSICRLLLSDIASNYLHKCSNYDQVFFIFIVIIFRILSLISWSHCGQVNLWIWLRGRELWSKAHRTRCPLFSS